MRTLRQQHDVELWDLSPAFQEEVFRVWSEFGIDAARCFAIGA
jgi:hypothetical protein